MPQRDHPGDLRDEQAAASIDNGIFLDGSDSAMLRIGVSLLVQDGTNKDNRNTIGAGFSDDPGAVVRRVAAAVCGLVALALGTIVVWVSRQPIFLADGSDWLALSILPSLAAQVAGLIIFVAGAVASVFLARRSGGRIIVSLLTMFASTSVFAMATHTVTSDGKSMTLRERWLLMVTAEYELPEEEWVSSILWRRSAYCLEVNDRKHPPGYVFLGLGPWRLDPTRLLSHPAE